MQIRFDGKTVAVSGAGHAFGRCIAETFAALGARDEVGTLSVEGIAASSPMG